MSPVEWTDTSDVFSASCRARFGDLELVVCSVIGGSSTDRYRWGWWVERDGVEIIEGPAMSIAEAQAEAVTAALEQQASLVAAALAGTIFVETQRQRRGHDLFPRSIANAMPSLEATEDVPIEQKVIHLRAFGGGAAEWLMAEIDPVAAIGFGLCDLGIGFPEWGYVDLHELEELSVADGLVIIERDLYFTPRPFGEIRCGGAR